MADTTTPAATTAPKSGANEPAMEVGNAVAKHFKLQAVFKKYAPPLFEFLEKQRAKKAQKNGAVAAPAAPVAGTEAHTAPAPATVA